MSLRYEQYHALKRTREFLRSLLTRDTRPKTVKELREKASWCLRHFPPLCESGQPMWSLDDFTKDELHQLPPYRGSPRTPSEKQEYTFSMPVWSTWPSGEPVLFQPKAKGKKKCRR